MGRYHSGLLGALQSYLEVSWHFGYRKPKASYAPAVCLVAFGKHEEASPEVAYGRGACEQNHDIVVDHALLSEEAEEKSGKGRSPVGLSLLLALIHPSTWKVNSTKLDFRFRSWTSVLRSSRKFGATGLSEVQIQTIGTGPSFAGLRPLSWLSRWPTTSEGVSSE